MPLPVVGPPPRKGARSLLLALYRPRHLPTAVSVPPSSPVLRALHIGDLGIIGPDSRVCQNEASEIWASAYSLGYQYNLIMEPSSFQLNDFCCQQAIITLSGSGPFTLKL